MSENIKRELYPEELRYRFSKYQRSIEDIIKQRVTIANLWPRQLLYIKKKGDKFEDCEFIYKEWPEEVKQLDSFLQTMIDNAFQEIVIEGK